MNKTDKIYLYFTKSEYSVTNADFFNKGISLFQNKKIVSSILKYKKFDDKVLSLLAKLLLRRILIDLKKDFLLDTFDLDSNKKPFISNGIIGFSHAGSYATAFFAQYQNNTKIGIDIEFENFCDINDALKYLKHSYGFNGKKEQFYWFWCRLESMLKALSTGFLKELYNVKIFSDFGIIDNEKFYFHKDKITDSYKLVIACNKQNFSIEKKEINPAELLV